MTRDAQRNCLCQRTVLCGIAAVALTVAMVRRPALADEQTPKRPNIVLIMADDMGFSDIGCYGGEIETPNLDRLAAGGLRFTQFYNTGRCCPTRAALMTGLYQHQTGVGLMMSDRGFDAYRGDLNDRCVTIAEVLETAGYRTYMSGKWHVTRQVGHWSGNASLTSKHNWPRQRGFDRFYGTIHGAGSFYDPATLTEENTPVEKVGDGYYYTDAISDKAAQYIDDHAGTAAGAPFFIYVAYTAPHWPLHAKPEDIAKYRGRYDGGWDAIRAERHRRMIAMGLVDERWDLTDRDSNERAWEDVENKAWQARRMEVYAAQIDSMDQGIGRITDALRRQEMLDNTLIFFLADNGGCAEELSSAWKVSLHIPAKTHDGRPVAVGNNPAIMPGAETNYQSYGRPWANASNTPFRKYKHWNHEGGIATPLVVHWPDRIKGGGQLRRQSGHLIDVMPTCVEVAGAKYPTARGGRLIHPMEGRSLVPVFGDGRISRRALFWEHHGNRAVRIGDWKLVADGWKGDWELYNLKADRTERNDLAESQPARAAELAARWDAWAKRVGVMTPEEMKEKSQTPKSGGGSKASKKKKSQ